MQVFREILGAKEKEKNAQREALVQLLIRPWDPSSLQYQLGAAASIVKVTLNLL